MTHSPHNTDLCKLDPIRLCAIAKAKAAPRATDYEVTALTNWAKQHEFRDTNVPALINALDKSNSAGIQYAASVAYKQTQSMENAA